MLLIALWLFSTVESCKDYERNSHERGERHWQRLPRAEAIEGKVHGLGSSCATCWYWGKQWNARGELSTPCGIWEQPHSLGIILSPIWRVARCIACAEAYGKLSCISHPWKTGWFKKGPFLSTLPSIHSSHPSALGQLQVFGCPLFTQLPHWLLGRFLRELFLSNSWSSLPKNNVSFVVSWKCSWGIHYMQRDLDSRVISVAYKSWNRKLCGIEGRVQARTRAFLHAPRMPWASSSAAVNEHSAVIALIRKLLEAT